MTCIVSSCTDDSLHLRQGLMLYLQYILRLKEGALVFSGLPCSSFVWVSRSTTCRSKAYPMGDSSKPSTRRGNLLAVRWVLGVVVALVRRCQWGCEQPSSSLLPYIGAVRFLMQINVFGLGFPPAHIVRLYLGHTLNPNP